MAIVGATMQIAFWSIIVPVGILVASQLFKTAFYAVGTMLFWVIDLLQDIFRKLAGLEDTWIDGQEGSGDVLINVLKSQVVVDTLISVTVFAVALVIIATIVQMVRTEYTTEGSKNSKEGIIGKALKSLVMFILIPVVCLFGIRTSNYLLKAVDAATSGGGSSSISGSIFLASATNANRIANEDAEDDFNISNINITSLLSAMIGGSLSHAVFDGASSNYYVVKYKDTFKSNATSPEKARSDIGKQIDSAISMPKSETTLEMTNGSKISYENVGAVSYFYSMNKLNIIVLYVAAYLVLKSLFSAALGMIVRIYKCTALFIIAPAAIGLQPLDDGSAYKKWKGQFISNVLSAYGIVVGLNIFFVVSGIVSKISLWNPDNWINYGLNRFMQAFFIVAGATQLNAIAKMMGDLIGAADAMADGAGVTKGIGELTSGMGKMAGGAAKMGAGVASKLREGAAGGKAFKAKRDLARIEADNTLSNDEKEKQRAEATGRLQQAEVARQVNRNRSKAAFGSTQLGQMWGNVTGGVSSVMNGDWAKGTDDKTLAKLEKSGIDPEGKIGKKYVEDLNEKDEARSKRALLHVATGGGLLAGSMVPGLIGGIKGASTVDPSTGKKAGAKGFFKGAGKGIVGAGTWASDALDTAFGDGNEGNTAARNKSAVAASTSKMDAISTVDEQSDAGRQVFNTQKQAVMFDAEKEYGKRKFSKYTRQKELAADDIDSLQGLTKSGDNILASTMSVLETIADRLMSKSNKGSDTYKQMEQLKNLIGDGSWAIGGSDREKQINALLSGLDKDFLSREVGAMQGVKSRETMAAIHAGKAKIDELQTGAHTTINGATPGDDKAVGSALEKFTQEMTKEAENNADVIRDALEKAMAAGLTIRGTDGKPLEVNSKAFVDAVKDLKRATEEASSKKQEKEMAKTLQDMLKELKKKK